MDKGTITVSNISDLEEVVTDTLQTFQNRNSDTAAVLALHGQLGAGKTTFVQLLAKKIGIEEVITSPTFVILKQYVSNDGGLYKELIHIDAYRIEDVDEMNVLKFTDLLEKKDTIICIEWAEKIEALLPKNTLYMHIAVEGDKRVITFNG